MRTGSTWIADLLSTMLNTSWEFWSREREIQSEMFDEEIKKPLKHNIVIKLHYSSPKTICDCIPKGDRNNFVISITRDIRDVAVSKILYMRYDKPMRSLSRLKDLNDMRKKFGNKKLPDRRYVNLFIKTPHFNHIVKNWKMYNDGYTHPNYLLITYEELHARRRFAMKKICDFLGIYRNNKGLRQVITKNNFMSSSGRQNGKEIPSAFRRKGIVGDYKNYINKRNLERIDELLKKL